MLKRKKQVVVDRIPTDDDDDNAVNSLYINTHNNRRYDMEMKKRDHR